jgi:hypothetical protein
MGVKACMDSSISKVPLHVGFLFLCLSLDVVKLNPLSFDI